jgi:two-component system, chemotaxis family, CheB/CheR fusion protein
VRREVQALGETAADRVTVRAQDVSLPMEHIQTLGLALHELATNAVKHGALKEQAGHLDITWTIERNQQSEAILVLNWHETGLSAPPESSRRGFGRHLIERALAHTMRAKTEIQFRQDGITCRIAIPLTQAQPHPGDDSTRG